MLLTSSAPPPMIRPRRVTTRNARRASPRWPRWPGRSASSHAYDAALGWEKRGRPDQAARTFAEVVTAEEADAALRARARFHLGRLHYERGDMTAAREHSLVVLQATPDHRRARIYLEAIERLAERVDEGADCPPARAAVRRPR